MDRPDDIFSLHSALRDRTREAEMSLAEYLQACSDDPRCYASPAERMLRAIGEPDLVDTSRDPRLARLAVVEPWLAVPDPRRAVLDQAVLDAQAIRVEVTNAG